MRGHDLRDIAGLAVCAVCGLAAEDATELPGCDPGAAARYAAVYSGAEDGREPFHLGDPPACGAADDPYRVRPAAWSGVEIAGGGAYAFTRPFAPVSCGDCAARIRSAPAWGMPLHEWRPRDSFVVCTSCGAWARSPDNAPPCDGGAWLRKHAGYRLPSHLVSPSPEWGAEWLVWPCAGKRAKRKELFPWGADGRGGRYERRPWRPGERRPAERVSCANCLRIAARAAQAPVMSL